jgi:magnesium-transporting ATPase (P-type)
MSKVYIRYGIAITVLLIVYFLLSKLVGLHHYPVFSSLNGVIFGAGILMAMKKYKSQHSRFKYEKGFQVGLFTGAIATIFFAVFMAVYMYQIDSEFSNNIIDSWKLNYESGTAMILASLVLMGFSTTFVLTLAFMQLLKESWNTKDSNRKES